MILRTSLKKKQYEFQTFPHVHPSLRVCQHIGLDFSVFNFSFNLHVGLASVVESFH